MSTETTCETSSDTGSPTPPETSADSRSKTNATAASKPSDSTLALNIAASLKLPPKSVIAALELFAQGATVPFIARYRKERTGELDEVALRDIAERHSYLVEVEARKETVLASIESQGKLTDSLRKEILACTTKVKLEDLYLPYKSKRRTKATIAREAGLEPLAQRILLQPVDADPQSEAQSYVAPAKAGLPDTEVKSADDALTGAREIIAESVIQRPEFREQLREVYRQDSELRSERAPGQEEKERSKFEDYFEHSEPAHAMPSHRYLAIRRGEREGALRTSLVVDLSGMVERCKGALGHNPESPYAPLLSKAVEHAVQRRLSVSVETDLRLELKKKADLSAVSVFAENLQNLLLSPPLGTKSVLGIDPGLRTGCKCAMLDATGKLLEHFTIYPLRGRGDEAKAKETLKGYMQTHKPQAVAVGNGTGGRETEKLVRQWSKEEGWDTTVVSVSEAGASIYSASEIAREEFPDLDLTVRGAISIARRLQDPLAELVKVDPKSIGVGQYQHDVQQSLLQKKLSEVVESCVNRVGVELNTASAPLLSYVAGIGPSLAKKIVAHRSAQGAFRSRNAVTKVSGFGAKAFEQAGGFLRVSQSEHPLDRSAVHPERYGLVETIAKDLQVPLQALVGQDAQIDKIKVESYLSDEVGPQTMKDILAELKKPGRDPRKAFEAVKFRDDVNEISDLTEGMQLSGIVTNVTAFGAFVDIGVHQDGLVHISQLADRFIKDPSEVVSAGDKIQVRVMSVDLERKRIALSARKQADTANTPGAKPKQERAPKDARRSKGKYRSGPKNNERSGGFSNNPFAALKNKTR